jgi:hypothetical protein
MFMSSSGTVVLKLVVERGTQTEYFVTPGSLAREKLAPRVITSISCLRKIVGYFFLFLNSDLVLVGFFANLLCLCFLGWMQSSDRRLRMVASG